MAMKYAVRCSTDRCEFSLHEANSTHPAHVQDSEGRDMVLVAEFNAATWDEAKKEYEKVMEREREQHQG